MVSIIAFIVVIFGAMNWLSIGMFQYDLVAGLFGYQGSIFSRMVYIFVGVCACWLVYSVIKNKGRLNAKKLKHDERVMYDKHAKQEQVLREVEQENAQQEVKESNTDQSDETSQENSYNVGRNHANI